MLTFLRKRIGLIVGLLVVVGGVYAYWRYTKTHAPPLVEYKTQQVVKRRVVGRVTASGTLQATVTVQVGTQVSGRIQKLFADFNSTVKKGQLVAKIDPQLFQAAVQQANANAVSSRASLVKAQAQARDAELVFNRTKALNEQNLASAADLQTAETALAVARASVDVAKASVEQSEASLHQAKVNLDYTNIVSPIDGVVISRSVDVGQTVAASLQAPTLFTIAEDLRKMQVNTNVSEGDVGRLQSGQDAFFTVDAFPGQRFRGKIAQIRNAPQTVQNVVTYNALIDVDNSDLRLRPGMTANVTVTYAERDDVLAVPNAALRFRPPPESGLVAPGGAGAGGGAGGGAGAGAGAGGRRGRTTTTAAVGDEDGGAPGRPRDDGESSSTRTLWLQRGATPQAVTVKLGLSDGTWTEIVDGDVKEGEQAVVDATVAGKATSAASSAPPGGMRRMF